MKYSKEDTCVVSGHPSDPTVNSLTVIGPTDVSAIDVILRSFVRLMLVQYSLVRQSLFRRMLAR